MKIGFIGLGIMGSRMAANLQASGYELIVHNRTASKADDLIAGGAVWADSPAAVAQQVDLLFTMLATPESVSKMALGPDGFLDHLPAGALWVDCSTVNPSFSRAMAEQAAARQVRLVDVPVAGTKAPAASGDLLFVAGGSGDDLEACRPYFDIMGRQTFHVGEQGMGVSMKMVLNMLLGVSMLAFAEAMALGQSMGLESEQLLETLIGSAVVAPFVAGKRPNIESGAYEADFPLRWMQKDLQLAATSAYENGVAMPMENAAKETYALAIRQGLGDMDFSAIYQFINDSADTDSTA